MASTHDFKNFPELTNAQLEAHVPSPHPQITDDIRVQCSRVHDGDTIAVWWHLRAFEFPVRLLDIDAPELHERDGKKARDFLQQRILGQTIWIRIRKQNRVDKWGRLLGIIEYRGINMNELLLSLNLVRPFTNRYEYKIQSLKEILR